MAAGAVAGAKIGKLAGAAVGDYAKKKNKEQEKNANAEAQGPNIKDSKQNAAPTDKAAAGVRTGYNDLDEAISTSGGKVKVEGRVTVVGNNATVDVQNVSGPGSGKIGFSETRSLARSMADKVRSDYGITGDVTFSGLRVTGSRTGNELIGSVTFKGQ